MSEGWPERGSRLKLTSQTLYGLEFAFPPNPARLRYASFIHLRRRAQTVGGHRAKKYLNIGTTANSRLQSLARSHAARTLGHPLRHISYIMASWKREILEYYQSFLLVKRTQLFYLATD